MSNSAWITNRTAWAAAAMLVAQASVGVVCELRRSGSRAFHIALGTMLLPVVFVHAWFSMSAMPPQPANLMSLWMATAALFLLAFQAATGTNLVRACSEVKRLKTFHLVTGLAIVVFAGLHVWLIN